MHLIEMKNNGIKNGATIGCHVELPSGLVVGKRACPALGDVSEPLLCPWFGLVFHMRALGRTRCA